MSISILLFVLIKHYKCIDTWVWLLFSWQINWIFTYFLFIDSLDLQPVTELHKIVNELRVKYMTYCMEFDAHYVSMHLYFSSLSTNIVIWLNLFNVFVLFQGYVKRIDGMFFLTKGWRALRDFYHWSWCLGDHISRPYDARVCDLRTFSM